MKAHIIISIVCFAMFIGLLTTGANQFYLAHADYMTGIYMTAAVVCFMWASLFGGVVSLVFPKLKKMFAQL